MTNLPAQENGRFLQKPSEDPTQGAAFRKYLGRRAAVQKFKNYLCKMMDIFPAPMTPRQDVLECIASLHPADPGIPMIRLGPGRDGGYLVPDDLEGITACFSPGVGKSSEFEKDCADLGIQPFLADGSVEAPALADRRFIFTKKNIGTISTSGSMTMEEWISSTSLPSGSDLMLQMDIEGSEYEVFLSMPENLLRRFRIIAVEFHWLHMLWCRPFFRLISPVFGKILRNHLCVHIHPNNRGTVSINGGVSIPRTMEFSFLRRDRVKSFGYARKFPHELDRDNLENLPSIPLPACWYRGKTPFPS